VFLANQRPPQIVDSLRLLVILIASSLHLLFGG